MKQSEEKQVAVLFPYYSVGTVISNMLIETEDPLTEEEYATLLYNKRKEIRKDVDARTIQEALNEAGHKYIVGATMWNTSQVEGFITSAIMLGVKFIWVNEGYPVEFDKAQYLMDRGCGDKATDIYLEGTDPFNPATVSVYVSKLGCNTDGQTIYQVDIDLVKKKKHLYWDYLGEGKMVEWDGPEMFIVSAYGGHMLDKIRQEMRKIISEQDYANVRIQVFERTDQSGEV